MWREAPSARAEGPISGEGGERTTQVYLHPPSQPGPEPQEEGDGPLRGQHTKRFQSFQNCSDTVFPVLQE